MHHAESQISYQERPLTRKSMALIQHSSESAEWYTPSWLVDICRAILGGIDLDPCSSAIANETIKAKKFYALPDDGLAHPWHGSVFINPPGGRGRKSLARAYWGKLLRDIEEVEQEPITHAIYLAFNLEMLRTSQQCAKSLLEFPTCIFQHRIAYVRPDGTTGRGGPSHPSAITYVPGTVDATPKFISHMQNHGVIIV